VIIFSQIEGFGWQNLCFDGAIEPPACFLLSNAYFGSLDQLCLGFIMGKYCRFILSAPGSPGWVMAIPKYVEQGFVRDPGRVKINL
jgi:hypothetical protein